jgi:hypothetical protein
MQSAERRAHLSCVIASRQFRPGFMVNEEFFVRQRKLDVSELWHVVLKASARATARIGRSLDVWVSMRFSKNGCNWSGACVRPFGGNVADE